MTKVPATIVVHAGAGVWSGNREAALAACTRATDAGVAMLRADGTAIDAVLAAVVVLENDPACNAGTGAVRTSDDTIELDACIMDGSSRTSGAVGALQGFVNPILIANDVRMDGRYHLLVGDGAAHFATEHHAEVSREASTPSTTAQPERGNTVGAVALDGAGHLACATSTGGIAGKTPGRLGDTPIVGAGSYASDDGACSCTGAGESFVRACTAFWAVTHCADGAERAAADAMSRTLNQFGGGGGLILLRADGTFAIHKTTPAMPWAHATVAGTRASGL